MPLIAVALLILTAITYGAIMLYMTVAAPFGQIAGIAAVAVATFAIMAIIRMLIRRYQAVHGVKIHGERLVALEQSWGRIRLDAIQKQGELELNGQHMQFIFADITDARAVAHDKAWTVELTLKHHSQARWSMPMPNARQARR